MFRLHILQTLLMDSCKKTRGDEEFMLLNNIGVSFLIKKLIYTNLKNEAT